MQEMIELDNEFQYIIEIRYEPCFKWCVHATYSRDFTVNDRIGLVS